ncbi:response regulator [Aureimonas sp. SA4125]|uniref:response regulator transcription factor n=1 Tax=Aureimonas sp. SA4125 TaxID=2826993 RepID=UPI001CC7F92E|nr:response regulator [Aureimonas sp. SA4125]BDA85685.1 response regulator [Aureimonas sp. SA4125]
MDRHVAVLLVDDDAAVRGSLVFALELEGLAVRAYADPNEFISTGDFSASACLVIDYVLPGMDGIALLDTLRRRGVALPAILIAGRMTDGMRSRALGVGFAAILEKPLEDNALLDAIRASLASPLPASGIRETP